MKKKIAQLLLILMLLAMSALAFCEPRSFYNFNKDECYSKNDCFICRNYLYQNIQSVRKITNDVAKEDVNFDFKINCQDYALSFFLVGSISMRDFSVKVLCNDSLGKSGHMFNLVICNHCGTEYKVEPQGPLSRDWHMVNYWAQERGINYNPELDYIMHCEDRFSNLRAIQAIIKRAY